MIGAGETNYIKLPTKKTKRNVLKSNTFEKRRRQQNKLFWKQD